VQGKVLEPVDLTAAYKDDGEKRELAVEITKIVLNVSPDVLTILSDMSDTVWRPLQAASPDNPLHAVNKYKRICSSHQKQCTTPPFNSIGGGGLDFLGQEKGFTFWAPEAPPGHGILGHLITSGTSQPTQEVMSIALNSGVVAWPLKYEICWQEAPATVWRAVEPPGYVALGSFVTLGEKPGMYSMLCVHASVLVMAPVGECVVRSEEGSLWAVDSAAGSFFFSDCKGAFTSNCFISLVVVSILFRATLRAHSGIHADGLPATRFYDLRSPLGLVMQPLNVTPYIPEGLKAETHAYTSKEGQHEFRCAYCRCSHAYRLDRAFMRAVP
jgi:hypothetical protein